MYLDIGGIKKAFAEHMKKYRGYSDKEAAIAVSDFPDPYTNCYLCEDFVEDCEVDGIRYEKRASYTTFWTMGLDDVPMFRFYTYYRTEDIPHNTVGEYMESRKLYQVDDLDLDDFPEDLAVQDSGYVLDFTVTICLGYGDGGDVCVSVDVTDEEFELMKECYREYGEFDEYPGLEDLCERIEDAARVENESIMMGMDTDEEIDYDSVTYMIQMPDEVIEEVEAEDDECEDDESDD